MATGAILLFPGEVTLPDGTTNNAFAQAQVVKSSGTPPTNGPNLFFTELLFDPTTDEQVIFGFVMPSDYASGGTIKAIVKSGSASQAITLKAAVAAVTPGVDGSQNAKVFGTVSTANHTTSGTANAPTEVSISPSMDSAAANDMVYVMLGRDPDNASDTSAVDLSIVGVRLEYTTT